MRIEILNKLKAGKGNTWEFTGFIIDDKDKIPIGGNVPQDIKTNSRLKKLIIKKAETLMAKYEQEKKKPKDKVLDEDMIFVGKL